MSILYDYFLATSDQQAADVLTWHGGPGVPPRDADHVQAIELPGIEPVVTLGMLYELLTGRSWEEAADNDDIGYRDGGEVVVLRLSAAFQEAIAAVTDERLAQVMQPWSEIEEFWGEGDPDALLPMVGDLRQLARTGLESRRRLYCWISV